MLNLILMAVFTGFIGTCAYQDSNKPLLVCCSFLGGFGAAVIYIGWMLGASL